MVSGSRKGNSFSTNSGLFQNFFEASHCPNGIFTPRVSPKLRAGVKVEALQEPSRRWNVREPARQELTLQVWQRARELHQVPGRQELTWQRAALTYLAVTS